MKLLVEETGSEALAQYLDELAGDRDAVLLSSWLLHTELHCAAGRRPEWVDPVGVGQVLDVLTLVDLTRGDLLTAGSLPGRLRSHDALHLAVALRVGADALLGVRLGPAGRGVGRRAGSGQPRVAVRQSQRARRPTHDRRGPISTGVGAEGTRPAPPGTAR